MSQIALPFGKASIELDLEGFEIIRLEPRHRPCDESPAQLLRAALESPIEGPGLRELAAAADRVMIIIPDWTRKLPLAELLPTILRRLDAAGVTELEIVVACGTHPLVDLCELRQLVGELPESITLRQHDSRAELPLAGTTSTGLSIHLDPGVLAADLVITLSLVQHHYFAGFGGGPKMIFPGVAGYGEIQANHARVIDLGDPDHPRLEPGCQPGQISGNPLAEEIREAAALRPVACEICFAADSDGRLISAISGPSPVAHRVVCEEVARAFELPARKFDRLIASAGGAPVDRTLIQAHKCLDAACRFAAPGAELLFLAQLDRGSGSPEMEVFLDDPRPQSILDRLAARYVQYGHTAYRLVSKTERFDIHLHSGLAPELVERLGFHLSSDPQAVIDRWRTEGVEKIAVASGPAVYPEGTSC